MATKQHLLSQDDALDCLREQLEEKDAELAQLQATLDDVQADNDRLEEKVCDLEMEVDNAIDKDSNLSVLIASCKELIRTSHKSAIFKQPLDVQCVQSRIEHLETCVNRYLS